MTMTFEPTTTQEDYVMRLPLSTAIMETRREGEFPL
jgi:hypothetical protein